MTRVPPTPVRRIVVAPVVVALDAALVALSPLLVAVAAALGPLFGGRRPLRVVVILVESARSHLHAVLALTALWARAGFGRRLGDEAMQAAHYDVLERFLAEVHATIVRHARVDVVTDETAAAYHALADGERPVVVLSRHAGEGDTLLVLYELLCVHGRRPRVVMHEALRLDPLVDVIGSRLPNRFVDPRGGDTEVEIAAMASSLDDRSALVIFPEGANFTEERRRRGITRLLRRGHDEQAAAAEAMTHVSAPRPGGALAAIDAAPGADVVVMGHVGFPAGLREVWQRLPERQTIEVELWHEPADSIPADHEERIAWLFERWRLLDDWVADRRHVR